MKRFVSFLPAFLIFKDELPNYRQAVEELIFANQKENKLCYNAKLGIVLKNGDKYIDMNEYYLESQGEYCRQDNYEPKIRRAEPQFRNLDDSFIHLKSVLTKLTNDAYDFETFLFAIELISSLTLMFTIELEGIISSISEVKDREKLKLIKETFEKCCEKWPAYFKKQNLLKCKSRKVLKSDVVILAAKVSYEITQVMYFIKKISKQ